MNLIVGQTIQKMGPINASHFVKMATSLGFEHLEFDPTVFEDIEATYNEFMLLDRWINRISKVKGGKWNV